MKKIALVAALAIAGLPFAFAQTNPPASSTAPPASSTAPPASSTAPAKHQRRAKAHKRAKKEKSGAANRAMPGEK